MAGLIDRIGSLAGTDLGKAVDLGHRFYLERMGVHNHTGRALVETAAEIARNHPNLVGIGVGLLVEQFLAEQKRRHDVYVAELEGEAKIGAPPQKPLTVDRPKPAPAPKPHGPHLDLHLPVLHGDLIKLDALRPGTVALEVFGALVLLKLASTGLRWFRHDKQHEVWFAPAAKIRLWSGAIAAYYLVKSLKSPKMSAWRNAAVALFATDALKPVLKAPKRRGKTNPPSRAVTPVLSSPVSAAPEAPRQDASPSAAPVVPAPDSPAPH